MWSRGLGVLAMVAACNVLQRPPPLARRIDVHLRGGVFEIDRGYRVAALPEPSSSVVRVDVRYPVGSADDPPGKEGLAHLVEHLLFAVELVRGERRTSIAAELGRIAVSSNAEEHADYTTYQSLVDPMALPELLELEADRLAVGCAGLTEETVARERDVVLGEIRASRDDLYDRLRATLYPLGHPYRGVETSESVSKLELADVCDFLQTSYQRGQALVVASGAITQPELESIAAHEFVRLRKRDLAPNLRPPLVAEPPGLVRLQVEIDEPTLVITWPLPALATLEFRTLALGWDGIGTRLARRAARDGWSAPDTVILGGAYAPILAVSVVLADVRDLDRAIAAAEEATRLAAEDLDRPDALDWLDRWGGEAESVLARWESLDRRNAQFADFMQFDPGGTFIAGRIRELAHTTPRTARAIARTWLAPSRARYILFEPSGGIRAPRGHALHLARARSSHATLVDDTTADRPLSLRKPQLAIETERYTLRNGLDVVLAHQGPVPVVQGRLVIDSGTAHDPVDAGGIAALVGGPSTSSDTIVATDHGLATSVDDLVDRLVERFRDPEAALSRTGRAFVHGWPLRSRSPERTSYDLAFRTALYGNGHPYARPPFSAGSLANISAERVMEWVELHVVPNNATLILTGSFDAEVVKRQIEDRVAAIPSGFDSPDRDDIAHSTADFVAGTTDERPTVEVALAFVAGRGLDASYGRRLVLERVLAAQLAASDFAVSYDPRRGGGLWMIRGDVEASRGGEATAKLLALVDAMRNDPSSYRTAFVVARQRAIEALLLDAASSTAVADRLAMIARFGASDKLYDFVAWDIARLTLADFHAFVARELAPDRQVLGAFGNAEAISAVRDAATPQPIVPPFELPFTPP